MKRKIIIAITGASGSIYAKVLLNKLQILNKQVEDVSVVMSDNAKDVWKHELGDSSFEKFPFTFYEKNNFFAPCASGSSKFDAMIICPCSMGMLGRIASGVSDDLIARSADVMLKERRKLILVSRDTPLNLIHINNMKLVTEAGAIVMPASPSFYSKPKNFEELAATVIDRVLDLIGIEVNAYRWGQKD